MIPVFDLDDTLYAERRYVESGFWAVARWLEVGFGWRTEDSFREMVGLLDRDGRGRVFDALLAARGARTAKRVRECVGVYRHHSPDISLFPEAEKLLSGLSAPLFVVTDGHKVVQHKKIVALRIEAYFEKVYITHRYARRFAKPSPHCFELIKKKMGCRWQDMAYIGDNPAKDFVNLTPLGVRTIRVLTGEHRNVVAKNGYEASHVIRSLNELHRVL
jgi:putative hydrolase of the HAD superfamily